MSLLVITCWAGDFIVGSPLADTVERPHYCVVVLVEEFESGIRQVFSQRLSLTQCLAPVGSIKSNSSPSSLIIFNLNVPSNFLVIGTTRSFVKHAYQLLYPLNVFAPPL